jgi:hypothetical protein
VGDAGHIRNRIEIPCDNDEEAQLRTEQLVDGTRRVGLRPSNPKSSAHCWRE